MRLQKSVFFSVLTVIFSSSCQKEEINVGNNADDSFFIYRRGSSMPVSVRGNTASKVFWVYMHGGPGSSGKIEFYGVPKFADAIRKKYAVVIMDQRGNGDAQGNLFYQKLTPVDFSEDIRLLMLTLKHRYGNEISIFLSGTSWGGFTANSFLLEGNNQSLVRGYIHISASHNYRLVDSLSMRMMLDTAASQMARGKYVNEWQAIVDKIKDVNFEHYGRSESYRLNFQMPKAQKIIQEQGLINSGSFSLNSDIADAKPASGLGTYIGQLNPFVRFAVNDVAVYNGYSAQLSKITIPVLVWNGQYDFYVPPAAGQDYFDKIGSQWKKQVLFERSGHGCYEFEPEKAAQEAITFIERFR